MSSSILPFETRYTLQLLRNTSDPTAKVVLEYVLDAILSGDATMLKNACESLRMWIPAFDDVQTRLVEAEGPDLSPLHDCCRWVIERRSWTGDDTEQVDTFRTLQRTRKTQDCHCMYAIAIVLVSVCVILCVYAATQRCLPEKECAMRQ
jgi:hypothetical protein